MHAQAKEGRGYPAPCSSLRGKLFSQSETSEDFLTNNSLSQQKRSYQLSRPRERWTEEERAKFLEGLRIYGRGQWKKIGEFIGTKTAVQIRSHAQKVLGKMATQEQKPQEQQQALNFQWLGGRSTTQATGGDQGSSPEAAGNTGPATGPAISNTAARQHYPNTGPTSAHPAEAMTRTISYNVKESMIRWANVQGLGSREGAGGQSGSRSSIPHMKTIEAVASAAAAAAAAAAKAVLMAAGGDVARKIHMRAAAGMLPHLLNPLSFVQPLQAAANQVPAQLESLRQEQAELKLGYMAPACNLAARRLWQAEAEQRKTMGQSQDLLTEGKLDVAGKDKPRIIPVQVRNCESSDRQTPKPSAAADALLQQLGSYPRAIAANCDLESGSRLAQERRQLTPPSGNHNFRSGSGSGSGDNAGSGGGGGSGSGGAADFEIQHGSGGSGNNTDRHPNALGQQRPNQLLEGSHVDILPSRRVADGEQANNGSRSGGGSGGGEGGGSGGGEDGSGGGSGGGEGGSGGGEGGSGGGGSGKGGSGGDGGSNDMPLLRLQLNTMQRNADLARQNLQHPKLWKQRPSSLLAEPTAVAASGSDQAQQSQQQLLPPLVLKPQVRQPYLLSLHRRHQHQEDQDHQHHQHQHHHHAQAPERKHLHSLSPEPHIGPKSSTPPPGFGLPSNLSSGSRPKVLGSRACNSLLESVPPLPNGNLLIQQLQQQPPNSAAAAAAATAKNYRDLLSADALLAAQHGLGPATGVGLGRGVGLGGGVGQAPGGCALMHNAPNPTLPQRWPAMDSLYSLNPLLQQNMGMGRCPQMEMGSRPRMTAEGEQTNNGSRSRGGSGGGEGGSSGGSGGGEGGSGGGEAGSGGGGSGEGGSGGDGGSNDMPLLREALKAARQQNEATPSLQTQSSIPTLWQQMLVPSLLDPKAMGQLGAQGVQQSLQQLLFGAAVADPKAMGQLGAQGVQQSLQQLLFGAAVVDPPVGAPLLQHAALPPLANQEDINKVRATATEAFAHNGLTREQSQQLTQVASALQLANTLAGPLAASLQMPNPNEVQRSSRMAAASGGLDAPSAYIASCNIDTAAQVEAKPPGFNASTREVSASTPQDVLLRSEKDAKANGGKACRLSADPEGTPPTEQQLVMEAAPPRVRTSRRTPPGSGQGDDGGGASSHLSWSAGSEETPNGSDTDEEGEGDEGQGEGADTPGDLADKMVDGQQPRYRYSTLGLELPWSIKQRQEQHRQHVVLPASAPLTQGAQDRPGQDDARMDVGRDEEENISDHRADAGGGGADARPQGPPPPVGNGQHWKQRLKQQRRMHVISPAGSGASSSGVQAGGGERSLGQDVANCPKAGVYRYGERGENVFEQDTATSNGDLDPAGASASRGPSRPISIHICKTRPALLTSPQKGVPPMSLNPALLLLQRLHNTAAIPQGLGNTRPNGTMGGSIDELGCVRAGTSNESGSLEGSVQGSNEPGPDAPGLSNPTQDTTALLPDGQGASWKKVRRLSQPEGQQLFCTIPALQDAPPPGAAHMQGLSSGLPGVNNLANLQAGLVPALSSGGLYEGGRDAALVLCHVTRRLSHTTREDGNAVENHVGPDVNGQDDNDDEEYLNLPNGPAASTDAYVGKQAQGSSGGHDGSNEPGEMGSTPYNGMGSAPHNGMGSAPHNGMVSREGGSSSNGNSGTHNGDGPAEVATVGADAGAAEFGAASADFHASAAKISAVAAENSAAAARMSIAAAGAATVVKVGEEKPLFTNSHAPIDEGGRKEGLYVSPDMPKPMQGMEGPGSPPKEQGGDRKHAQAHAIHLPCKRTLSEI